MSTITGILFADTNHWHPFLNGALYAHSSPILGIKIGQTSKDSAADSSVAQAEAASLLIIGYIFGTDEPGESQAERLAEWFPWKPGRMWAVDVERNEETPSDSISDAQALACVNRLRRLHPEGLDPWSYSLQGRTVTGAHHWIAHYADELPAGADAWQFYGGVVGPHPHIMPGVKGPICDMNRLVAPLATVRQWAGLADDASAEGIPELTMLL
jgi:hypothetical protein